MAKFTLAAALTAILAASGGGCDKPAAGGQSQASQSPASQSPASRPPASQAPAPQAPASQAPMSQVKDVEQARADVHPVLEHPRRRDRAGSHAEVSRPTPGTVLRAKTTPP